VTGSSETPDVFINATGPRVINTQWLPRTWLDVEKRVLMRDSYFPVKYDGTNENIYATGVVVSVTNKTAIKLGAMVPTVASSTAIDILRDLGLMNYSAIAVR
jgi:apoptosis-inducing factor 2